METKQEAQLVAQVRWRKKKHEKQKKIKRKKKEEEKTMKDIAEACIGISLGTH